MCATPPTILCRSFLNFTGIFVLYEDMHMLWTESSDELPLFPHFELSHVSVLKTIQVYREWVPCVCNSSYNFMPIFVKLYRCSKMCLWFGYYNPQMKFFPCLIPSENERELLLGHMF